MHADDVPTEVTKLVYTCPLSASKAVSQNQVAELLAHYWPAIEKHIREQVAQEIEHTADLANRSLASRPQVERGQFLNDWQWAARVARESA